MRKKIWKKIPEFTSYECSNDGEIKTFNWKNKGIERIMKPAFDTDGYFRTALKRDSDGKICTVKYHRIVALTFIPNPSNKETVNHKNSVKTDNRVENLEWATRSENISHSYEYGISSNVGQLNPISELSDKDALEILNTYEFGKRGRSGKTKYDWAKEYNTTFDVIKMLVQGRTYQHLLTDDILKRMNKSWDDIKRINWAECKKRYVRQK
jgi:hypothetical protein